MTLKALVAAACLCFGTATAGLAATVTVNGEEFDIGFIAGSFEDNESLLSDQPFFGNDTLAVSFAEAVVDTNILTDICDCRRLDFATAVLSFLPGVDFVNTVAVEPTNVDSSVRSGASVSFTGTNIFATATPASSVSTVPLPAGGLLLLSGLVGVAGLKRRSSRAA